MPFVTQVEKKKKKKEVKQDQGMGGWQGRICISKTLSTSLYEVAAQPIDGQRTDNAANQYPLQLKMSLILELVTQRIAK